MAGKQSQVETELDLWKISIHQLQGGGNLGGKCKTVLIEGPLLRSAEWMCVLFSWFLALVSQLDPSNSTPCIWVPVSGSMPGHCLLPTTAAAPRKGKNTLHQSHLALKFGRKSANKNLPVHSKLGRQKHKTVEEFSMNKSEDYQDASLLCRLFVFKGISNTVHLDLNLFGFQSYYNFNVLCKHTQPDLDNWQGNEQARSRRYVCNDRIRLRSTRIAESCAT